MRFKKEEKPIIIHVNQLTIRKNTKHKTNDPAVVIRGKNRNFPVTYCHEADFIVDGKCIGSIVYDPEEPLDCGARVFIVLDPEMVTIKPRQKCLT